MIIWLLYLALAVYFILDAYHTQLLLAHGHVELNPLLRVMINEVGIWLMYVYKILLLILLGCFLYKYQGEKNGTNHTKGQLDHV
jgi:hypothetical protein